MGVCNCSMFCCTLLYVHSSIAIVMVERLFLQFVIVVFPDHTHLLFLFLFCYERDFMLSLSDNNQTDIIEADI